MADLWLHERAARADGHRLVAGLDEVGRGPLAGPVVAACVILPDDFDLDGIGDSKKLSPRQRERADARIRRDALAFGIGSVDASEIDRVNILQASREAMRLALRALPAQWQPTLALVDGLPFPHLPCPAQIFLVGGDGLSASIAAASIVAKVYRDALMTAYAADFPAYGFAAHKGYPSPTHLAALRQHGPCVLHRRSFGPVRTCETAPYPSFAPSSLRPPFPRFAGERPITFSQALLDKLQRTQFISLSPAKRGKGGRSDEGAKDG